MGILQRDPKYPTRTLYVLDRNGKDETYIKAADLIPTHDRLVRAVGGNAERVKSATFSHPNVTLRFHDGRTMTVSYDAWLLVS